MEQPISERRVEATELSLNGGLFIQTAGSQTFASDWAAIASLNKKMANVMGQLKAIQQDEKHQQGWRYASYSAVVEALRGALSKQGVGLYANLIQYEQHPQGKGIKSTVEVEFTFADGETGALRTSRWAGEAMDFGVADKGLNKAYTAAEKYFLMRTFLVSTSDDVEPDATSEPKQQDRQQAAPKSQAKAPFNPPKRVEPTPQESTRPYSPETVKAGVLSRASKVYPVVAEQGFRGLVIDYVEGVWKTEPPDVREANRHLVFTYLFGSPTSMKMTTGQGKGVLDWLTDPQPDGKAKLNAYAVIEANMIVKLQALEETAAQRLATADAEMRDQLERDIELGETGPGPEGM